MNWTARVEAPNTPPRLLSLRQAAAYLGVSFWSVRDYVLQGVIPTVSLPALTPREGEGPRRPLRRVLVDVVDLDAFILEHKAGAAHPVPLGTSPRIAPAVARIGGAAREPKVG
jgi:hypothetical protein